MTAKRAFTLPEILTASVIIVILFASAIGTFVMVKAFASSSMSEQELQRDIDVIMGRIVRGMKEGTDLFGLRSAKSFTIPSIAEIDFTGTDANIRKYYLSGASIVYESPAVSPAIQTVYIAPAGATVILRFWEPAGYMDHETVGVYICVTKQAGGKTVSGSLSTYVNLRNIPKS